MRSIVDIANWYLQNMNDSNKQGLEIKQALSTEKGVRPSLRYGDKSDLIISLVDVGLPLSYCPLIVRDESNSLKKSSFIFSDLSSVKNKKV
mgnify:CR=1 FL=1